jgi:hypothetical protein
MRFTPVASTNIEGMSYSRRHRVLRIRFRSTGAVYEYSNVSAYLAHALRTAESVGKFFAKAIRPFASEYPYRRIA